MVSVVYILLIVCPERYHFKKISLLFNILCYAIPCYVYKHMYYFLLYIGDKPCSLIVPNLRLHPMHLHEHESVYMAMVHAVISYIPLQCTR